MAEAPKLESVERDAAIDRIAGVISEDAPLLTFEDFEMAATAIVDRGFSDFQPLLASSASPVDAVGVEDARIEAAQEAAIREGSFLGKETISAMLRAALTVGTGGAKRNVPWKTYEINDDDAADLASVEKPDCPICAKPIEPSDLCSTDIELGTCHAACLTGSPTVDLDTGEPVDGQIPTFRHSEAARPPVGLKPVECDSPEEWELEQRASHGVNSDWPEEARKLIVELWWQYCFAAERGAALRGKLDLALYGERRGLYPTPAWQTMDSAPQNGHAVLLLVPEDSGFIYTVEGAYQNGQWNAAHRDNVQPTHWSWKLPSPGSSPPQAGDRGSVKVKPLEWTGPNLSMWVSEPMPGYQYRIIYDGRGHDAFNWFVGGTWKPAVSLEAAKAAAQADYEQRILSSLSTPQPVPAAEGDAA